LEQQDDLNSDPELWPIWKFYPRVRLKGLSKASKCRRLG